MTPETTCPHCLNPIAVATPTQPITTCPLCGGLLATAESHVQPGLPDRAPEQPHAVQEGLPRPVTGAKPEWGTDYVDIRLPPRTADLRDRTNVAVPFIGLVMVTELGCGGAELYRYSLMQKLREGPEVDLVAQITASDSLVSGAVVIRQLVFVVATIVYLMWVYRAYKNLTELRVAGLNHSPGWAVGIHFVPILNLFRGFTVMQEIWKGSDPQRIGDDRQWTHARGSGLVWLWWLLYLTANVVNSLGANTMNMAHGTGSVQTFMGGEIMNLISIGLYEVSGIALILILRGVTDRQEQRLAALTERAA